MYVNMHIIDVCIQLDTCRRTSTWESCSTCSRVQLFNFAVRIKSRLAASLPRVMTWLIAPFKSSAGWWFGTWLLFSMSYMGCHPPTSGFHIFQRGRSTTNQSWSGYLQRHFASKLEEPRGPIVWLIITIPMVFIGALSHFAAKNSCFCPTTNVSPITNHKVDDRIWMINWVCMKME